MKIITSTDTLRSAIQLLEVERTTSGELFKEQFFQTYESFKPVNLLRGVVKDILSAPHLTEDVLGATVGLAAGYLTKKIIVGKSDDNIRNLVGSVLGNGVTNLVAQHPEMIKAIFRYIISIFSTKTEENTDNQ